MKDKLFVVTIGKNDCDHLANANNEEFVDVLINGEWKEFSKEQLNFSKSLNCNNPWCGRKQR